MQAIHSNWIRVLVGHLRVDTSGFLKHYSRRIILTLSLLLLLSAPPVFVLFNRTSASQVQGNTAAQLSPASSDMILVTGASDQIRPALAYNNSKEYFLVWEEEYELEDHDIYGQLFNAQGEVDRPFPVANSRENESNPAVVYNSVSNEYLVVWEYTFSDRDQDIYAMRIDSSGTPTGALIYVATSGVDETLPAVAAGPQGYLVVWEYTFSDRDQDIYAQRISLSGSLEGGLIYIDVGETNQTAPQVDYYSSWGWNGYLAVWQDQLEGQTTYDIHGRRISSAGDLPEREFTISQLEYDQVKPHAAFGSDDCLVVWQDHRSSSQDDWKIYAQRLSIQYDGTLQLAGAIIPVSTEGSQNRLNPAVTSLWSGTSHGFMVAWEYEVSQADHDILARRLKDDGSLDGEVEHISDSTGLEGMPAMGGTSICPMITWEDGRDQPTQKNDLYGDFPTDELCCGAHCDCQQGHFCYYGKCLQDPETPVYCCTNPGCPPGRWCFNPDGSKGTCSEDPAYYCESACDCGSAHCCKDHMCVKDIDDPWDPGGVEVGPSCVEGVDATYCCSDNLCIAGWSAYAGQVKKFRCYDPQLEKIGKFCSGKQCYGTACNCAPGESCVDFHFSINDLLPVGKTCFLLQGGACISNAQAEAVFGYSPADLIPCLGHGCFPGQNGDSGWQSGGALGSEPLGGYAFSRVTGVCGSCGNSVCDQNESPSNCAADCRCGDGRCSPSEQTTCPSDCGVCGDAACEPWESPHTCPQDCTPSKGDNWCELDEIWSYPADCGCPDAPYYPGQYAVCGDKYFSGSSPTNPETTFSCPDETGSNSLILEPSKLASMPIIFSQRYGGQSGAKAAYFAPDLARGIAVKGGSIYLTGQSFSSDFPVTFIPPASISSNHNGDWDAFAMRLDTQGSLNFSRYLGLESGCGHDEVIGRDLVVDDSGNIYITGSMEVVKLSAEGGQVVTYTTGIYDGEGGYGIALDQSANIYLSGSEAVGVIKLNPDGSLAYHTTGLGGAGYDIAVDPSGNVYIAGTMGVIKLNPSGKVIAATPLNGIGYSIVYKNGSLYVAGFISSAGLPVTLGAFDTSYNQSGDAFVAKLSTDLDLVYSSYLGGGLFDIARGIAVDDIGSIYVTGYTFSVDFPVSANEMGATLTGLGDAFLVVLNPGGVGANDLLYGTFIGGNDPAVSPYLTPDRMFAIALDEEGFIYLAGEAGSYDFPVSQTNPINGFSDIVVMKLSLSEHLLDNSYLPLIHR